MPAAGKKKKQVGFAIEHEVLIKTQAKKVYHALTTTEGVQGWWTPECTIPAEKDAVAELSFNGKHHMKMRIAKLESNRIVSWECLQGEAEWIGTTITFKLVPDGMATKLVFEHAGWKKKTDFFKTCAQHWGGYMQSIKLYCETGMGKPYGS